MGSVTIYPSVTEEDGVEAGMSVTTWFSITSGTTTSASYGLKLMSGDFLLLMNDNTLGLI